MADFDFEIKQNDTWPSIGDPTPVVLEDQNGPINLTGATVKFMARKADLTGTPITGNCTIVSAVAGTVRYDWSVGDTVEFGEYVFEFQITFGDGKIGTVPNVGYKSLKIHDDIAN